MTIAGQLDIYVNREGTRITSTRPLGLATGFAGRKPADVVAMIPLVYGICGMAQGVAAARACEKALGIEAGAAAERARELLVLAETAREHLLRIGDGWARAAGREPDARLMKRVLVHDLAWRKALMVPNGLLTLGSAAEPDAEEVAQLVKELAALMTDAVLGERPRAWLGRGSRAALGEWAQERTTPAAELMRRLIETRAFDVGAAPLNVLPRLEKGALANILLGPSGAGFIAAPTWQGLPRETTTLSRSAEHRPIASLTGPDGFGLGARLAARLAELAALPARMEAAMAGAIDSEACTSLPPGTGVAQIEAARGRLVHAVTIDGDAVTAWRILAPTEWNFHPHGAATRALSLIAASGRADTADLADLMVTAFDPCVACKLEVD